MPKGADTPDSIRIRENQKRSRARRKDLIESLQKRVRDYELKGINATQEMQIAARKVIQENGRLVEENGRLMEENGRLMEENARLGEENARLRALLGVKGLGRWEDVSDSVSRCQKNGSKLESLTVGNVSEAVAGCGRRKGVDESFEESGTRAATMEDLVPTSCQHGEAAKMRCDEFGMVTRRSSVVAARPSAVEAGSFRPGLETSCEAATRMIIGMSGDKDMETVRSSLGCRGRNTCSVKNSTVLQIMSEM